MATTAEPAELDAYAGLDVEVVEDLLDRVAAIIERSGVVGLEAMWNLDLDLGTDRVEELQASGVWQKVFELVVGYPPAPHQVAYYGPYYSQQMFDQRIKAERTRERDRVGDELLAAVHGSSRGMPVMVKRSAPRARGAGRPAARRTSSCASSRGDPDLGDEPPGHPAPSCEAVA